MPVRERKPALMPLFGNAQFFRSVHGLRDLPPDAGTEIAFTGRSNVGKSSAINALANRKRLAFVSKTPGRTQAINFFSLGAQRFLVDLPGYGYAIVPALEKRQWEGLIRTYIESRAALRGLVVIMDARHPFSVLDRQLLEWVAPLRKPAHVLLTKADKLSKQQAMAALREAQSLARHHPCCGVQLFSAVSGTGVAAAQKIIMQWLKQQ